MRRVGYNMKKNLKNIVLVLGLLGICFGFTSCFPKDNGIDDKVNIVCTIFPQYDWVSQIVGNSHSVTYSMVVKNGVDLHSYQPAASDIIQISKADIFIYVGGESDKWVAEVLQQRQNKDMKIINLMELLKDSVKEEAEALQGEEETDAAEIEMDEHIWLSLKNAITCVKEISAAIIEKDPENSGLYSERTENYVKELNSIYEAYKTVTAGGSSKPLVFCDRFPFRYLCDEFNLDYIAAFPGCSAETEASFETVAKLTDVVKEYSVKALIKIDGSEDKLAKTVQGNSKYCEIITLDSMQSVTLRQAFNGTTYADIMRKNLEELKKALK